MGAWDGIKLKAQYLNSDNSMILIFQYHFWNISITNTIRCIIALDGFYLKVYCLLYLLVLVHWHEQLKCSLN